MFKWQKLYHDYLRGLKALEKEAEEFCEREGDFLANHHDLYKSIYCAINVDGHLRNDPYLIDWRM